MHALHELLKASWGDDEIKIISPNPIIDIGLRIDNCHDYYLLVKEAIMTVNNCTDFVSLDLSLDDNREFIRQHVFECVFVDEYAQKCAEYQEMEQADEIPF